MPKRDKAHFDAYTPQNRIKHAILETYLPAYLNALKNEVDRFHVDARRMGPGEGGRQR